MNRYKLPLGIILIGILFTLYLQLQISDEIFFSGDAGIKALLTKQIASGRFQFDLDLSAEPWVRNLWTNGLYPFDWPYVYHINEQYYIQYPYLFPLINAPFYALFGWRGLYIIPLISTWVIWYRFYVVCQTWRLGIISTCLGLFILIFATPLSMYSAMYWEHMLAVSLAFYGISIIVVESQSLSKIQIILSGILIGLSVWFRPELLFLIIVICLLSVLTSTLNLIFSKKIILIASMVLTVALFLGLNTIIYHHPLGIYSFALGINSNLDDSGVSKSVDNFQDFSKVTKILTAFWKLNVRQFLYSPIAFFSIILYAFIGRRFKRLKLNASTKFLFLIWVSMSFAVPLIGWEGGKEWGPRYLFIVIPIAVLLATVILDIFLKINERRLRRIVITSFLILLVAGTYVNTYLGTMSLSRDYKQRVLPALKFLQTNQNTVVAVSSQFINQELEAAFGYKVFFLTQDNEDLKKLSSVLLERGYQKFLYILAPEHKEKVDSLKFTSDNKLFTIEFSHIGNFGDYILYEALLT